MKVKTKIVLVCLLVNSVGMTQIHSKKSDHNNQSSNRGVTYKMNKYTLSSGGGVITGGNYQLTSSIGQIDAGEKAIGGNYEFRGGFLTGSSDLIFKNGFE